MSRPMAAFAVLVLAGCEMMDKVADMVGNTKMSVKLKNGEMIEGTLLKKGDGGSLFQVKYGTVTISSGDIASEAKKGEAPEPLPGAGRLAKWDLCVHVLASRPWAPMPVQIPATVVDKGVLKNVPYLSHRCGEYEFNVYGDPDQPAGVEIGIYTATPGDAARKHCVQTMLMVLNAAEDQQFLQTLNLVQAKEKRAGLTFEVTPPTAEDAYGGWWITIYDERAIEQQRATERELAQITVTRGDVKSGAGGGSSAGNGSGPGASPGLLRWKEHELKLARPPRSAEADQSRVYLRGVHRKNGAYVAPYIP